MKISKGERWREGERERKVEEFKGCLIFRHKEQTPLRSLTKLSFESLDRGPLVL